MPITSHAAVMESIWPRKPLCRQEDVLSFCTWAEAQSPRFYSPLARELHDPTPSSIKGFQASGFQNGDVAKFDSDKPSFSFRVLDISGATS